MFVYYEYSHLVASSRFSQIGAAYAKVTDKQRNSLGMLATAGLGSLQLRRLQSLHEDLIYTYNIIFGLVDLDCAKLFLDNPNETPRGRIGKLFVRHSRVDVRKYLL